MKSGLSLFDSETVSAQAERLRAKQSPEEGDFFCFGHGFLELRCGDPAFLARFRHLFAECIVKKVLDPGAVRTRCALRMDEDTCLASFTHPVPLDLFEFTLQHGADVGLVAANTKPESGGWRLLALDADPSRAVIAVSGDHILLDRSAPWQGVFAQVIINDVMRQQEDVLFFHAATASFRDCGIFLTGDKGGGKTTLALALAGHGCGFLGDEYGAVETKTRMILPMRRAVSIRPGPRAGRVDAILAGRSLVTDRTPDGTERIRASVADLLPDSVARPTRLTHAFFLRGFAPQPRLSSFLPGTGELPLLRPLLVTLWDQPPGKRVVEFLQMLDGVRCFHLEVGGTPDQTAEMILKALEVA